MNKIGLLLSMQSILEVPLACLRLVFQEPIQRGGMGWEPLLMSIRAPGIAF